MERGIFLGANGDVVDNVGEPATLCAKPAAVRRTILTTRVAGRGLSIHQALTTGKHAIGLNVARVAQERSFGPVRH